MFIIQLKQVDVLVVLLLERRLEVIVPSVCMFLVMLVRGAFREPHTLPIFMRLTLLTGAMLLVIMLQAIRCRQQLKLCR